MDLKTLLLDSTSSQRPLHCCRRVQLGKNSYAVTFEVKGKMLTVTRIKQIYAKMPLRTRLQRRQRFLQKLSSAPTPSANSSVSHLVLPEYADCATQTSRPQMRSRTTDTDCLGYVVNREQQTVRRPVRKQGTQTDPNTTCQRVQTERRTATRYSQTSASGTECASSQTESHCCSNQVQTEPMDDNGLREKEAVVFLLSEIGEMIINQNHLLQNNATLLSQISEMTMLSKIAARQKAGMRCCKRFEKNCKLQRHIRKRDRYRFHVHRKRRPYEMRNQWAQTTYPIGLCSKATQTRKESHKRRRWGLFRWRLWHRSRV